MAMGSNKLGSSERVLITGASGLIGGGLANFLQGKVEVVPCSRQPCGAKWVCYDALKPVDFDFGVDVIVHAAGPASPDLYVQSPVETIMANVYGLQQILEYARRCGARKVVYVSSSEIYGSTLPQSTGFRETDSSCIDAISLRSSYPVGKLAGEVLCASYVAEYGLDVSIVRPGHIYGPTCSARDQRVSSAFPWLAARGRPIVLKSDGAQVRNYTHVDDCSRAIVKVIERGMPGMAYNIAARCGRCSIREMAELVARAGGVALLTECATKSEKAAFNPMGNSSLDPTRLEALGWEGFISPEQGFTDTVLRLRERYYSEGEFK